MRTLLFVAALAFVSACSGLPKPGDDDAESNLACGVAPIVFDAYGDVVQGETADACVRVERKAVELEEGFLCKACPYDPLRLIVHTPDLDLDVRVDANDTSSLTYEPSHHNWADTIEATVDGASTRVRILYDVDGGWDLELTTGDAQLVLPVVGSR